jgi:hypothetical protein
MALDGDLRIGCLQQAIGRIGIGCIAGGDDRADQIEPPSLCMAALVT